MNFSQLKFRLGLHLLALMINFITLSWLIANTSYYAVILILLSVALLQVFSLWNSITANLQTLSRFFNSLSYEDYAQKLSSNALGKDFRSLSISLNVIAEKLQTSKHLMEQQSLYLNTILEHVETVVLVFNSYGEVTLFNRAGKRLLNRNKITNVNELAEQQSELHKRLTNKNAISRGLCSCTIDNQPHQLLLDIVEVRIDNQKVKIATIQNIQSELDDKEVRAWQEIAKVLTHEISNSITPITSLASSCNDILSNPLDEDDIVDLQEAIRTIERRGANLIHFIDDYRRLTKLPKLNVKRTSLFALIEQMPVLFKADLEAQAIQLEIKSDVKELMVMLDPVLIEQVIVNLIKNAFCALKGIKNPKLIIQVYTNKEHLKVSIKDNGRGILKAALPKIFIPFYTTKPDGSGIGLSLSKLIMQLHNGTISVQSELGKGSCFTLVL